MSQERTEQRFTDQQMRDSLQRLIEGKHSLHIPPLPDDDDFVIAAAIDEALKSRAHIAGLRATAQELFEGRTNDWAEIDRLNATIADMQERDIQIEQFNKQEKIDEILLNTERSITMSMLEKQDKEIERLKAIIEEKDDAIDEWKESYETAMEKNDDLMAKVPGQAEEIERLRAAIEKANSKCTYAATIAVLEETLKGAE